MRHDTPTVTANNKINFGYVALGLGGGVQAHSRVVREPVRDLDRTRERVVRGVRVMGRQAGRQRQIDPWAIHRHGEAAEHCDTECTSDFGAGFGDPCGGTGPLGRDDRDDHVVGQGEQRRHPEREQNRADHDRPVAGPGFDREQCRVTAGGQHEATADERRWGHASRQQVESGWYPRRTTATRASSRGRPPAATSRATAVGTGAGTETRRRRSACRRRTRRPRPGTPESETG